MKDNKDTAQQNISDEAIEEKVKEIEAVMLRYEKIAQQLDDEIFR